MKNIIIIDDILLFNPAIPIEGDVYSYLELEKIPKKMYLKKVYFITEDIKSIFNLVEKMTSIYRKMNPLCIVLMDERHRKNVWLSDVIKELYRKRKEEDRIPQLLSQTEAEVGRLDKLHVKKNYDQEGVPVYIKTSLAYGIKAGGMVAHATGVLSVLQKKYKEVQVFTTDYLPDSIKKDFVHHISLKGFWDHIELRNIYFNMSAYKEIAKELSGKRISYIYQRYALDNFLGARLASKRKVPLILEYNSSAVWTNRNWGGGRMLYEELASRIEMLNLNKADMIVCVSDELKDSLCSRGISEDKILVNYNGVDIQKYSPECDGRKIRERLGLGDKVVIGFSGSFGPFHGAVNLALAFGELLKNNPELKGKIYLLFIGEGVTKIDVERRIKYYRMENDAKCVGTVPFEEVQDYLAACDILVAPHVPNKDKSPFFGSPTKLFEYMAMGKAILASDLNQIGEILNEDCALLVEPGNIEELSAGIQELVMDPMLRERLGVNAREKAVKNHTWDKHVARILEKLENLYE